MIGKGAQYLKAAGFGRYRITAASLGSLDILGTWRWLNGVTQQAIMDAFGVDGTAVIRATNEYLNGIAASDKAKATALAALINANPIPYATIVYNGYYPLLAVVFDGASWIDTGITSQDAQRYDCVLSNVAGRGLTTGNAIAGSSSHYANRIQYKNDGKLQHQQINSRNIEVPISDFTADTQFALVCGYDNDLFTVNGVQGTYASYGGNVASGNFYIGVFANVGFTGTPGIFNAHNFNIYKGSNQLRQYFPVKRASDGVCSLYDLLNDRFEANKGTGTIGDYTPSP